MASASGTDPMMVARALKLVDAFSSERQPARAVKGPWPLIFSRVARKTSVVPAWPQQKTYSDET